MFFTSEFSRVVTRFDDCTLFNANFDAHSQRRRQAFVQKRNSFLFTKNCSRRWNFYLSCIWFLWWIKVTLKAEQSKSQKYYFEKGILGHTLLDCAQETTQTVSVIDKVAFIDFVKAFDSESNNDMHVCSTEPYIHSLTEIDSESKLSEMVVSQNDLATGFSKELNSCDLQCPNWPAIPNEKNSIKNSFLSSVPLNICC